jgi:two-component system chemotaxis response regulator CheB
MSVTTYHRLSNRVRVLVIDDSALMRKLIPQILSGDPAIEVVGTAMDGAFGLKKIAELKPDVVTLDLEMPRMDGIEMLRAALGKYRVPVIIVSSQTEENARTALKALSLGAFDFVSKPSDSASGHIEAIGAELALKIKVAASAGAPKMIVSAPTETIRNLKSYASRRAPSRVVAIGISTGGPAALQYLLLQLPADFPGCLLVVQHMPEGFTDMFARRLHESCALEVKEAQSGDLMLAGRVLIAPGNRHMKARRLPQGDIVVLDDGPPVNGHRPSADVLFRSVAKQIGASALGVIMTGMGDDGVEGLGEMKSTGSFTVAQDSESCVVDSMPRAAVHRGYADKVVSLSDLSSVLQAQCSVDRNSYDHSSPNSAGGPFGEGVEVEPGNRRRSS